MELLRNELNNLFKKFKCFFFAIRFHKRKFALEGAKMGMSWGGRITGAMKIAELEGGLARNELKQINEEIKEKGGELLSKAEIDTLALSVGAINAGLEMVGLEQLLKTVPGGDKILANLEKKSLRELATDKTIREQLRGVLAQYSKSIATEMSTEMLQETTNIVADEMARKLGGIDNTPLEQNVARVIDTGKATFGATLFLGGAGSAAKTAAIYTKQGLSKIEAKKKAESMTPEQRYEFIENNMDTLFKTVEDIPSVQEAENKKKLKDAYFNQIKKTGMEENEALANATLMSEAFATLAKNTGMNLDDVTNEANIVIQNMSDEQAQQQYEVDNSAALNGRVVFNESQVIDDELQKLYDDFDNLGEDYSDENDLNARIFNMQILQDIKDGNLSEENQQAAQHLIEQYEQTNPQLAAALRKASKENSDGIKEVEFQKIDRNSIESAFGDTVENIQDTVKSDILNILQDNGIDESEFNFEDIRIFGSYSTGKNKRGSDLDLLVQYSGDMREDDAFNMLNSEHLYIYDAQGKKVKIDINPINTATSGTIDEHLDYLDNLEPKFQKIDTAGAENNQTALARQEWKKKGIESKFFKKWFGDSKVVDENGKPLVVYYGSNSKFDVFDKNKIGETFGKDNTGFFFTSIKNDAENYADYSVDKKSNGSKNIYPVYVSLQKPLTLTEWAETKYYDNVQDYIDNNGDLISIFDNNTEEIIEFAKKNNYDGVFFNDTENEDALVIAFNPEQIKSVNNQGTFDGNNPNIYYQQKNSQKENLNLWGVKPVEYAKGKLNQTLNNLYRQETQIYFQSAAMKRSKFTDFKNFYNDVLAKPKNTKDKEQFNYQTKGGINLRIPHDTILHEQKKHKLSSDEWKDLLDNIDDVSDAALSKKKSRFDGKPILLKINTLTNTYGIVLEAFEKSNPLITTAFIDTEKNIDNWIKNEAISSGTKTSFLSNRLNNIITNVQPKFKPYQIQTYFQSAYQSEDVNSNINNSRGFTYQRKNFDGTAKENLIVLLNKKADKSTLMHEFAHVYLITLNNLAQHNDKAKELLLTVNKWLHYDGVEYTEFQHERFANNFVAYVKSGKAPSYGLKKVFENFRRWLNDMYSNLQAAEDVWIDPETEQVFEELLGNITINAQKQETEQIINKARNNSLRRYSDDVEKLKRKFEKKQLTEYQKRYRDTALSIVYYALKNSRIPEAAKYTNYNQLRMILCATPEYRKKTKGVAKQQEEIGNILAELDDAFSANDGFLDDWSEFFHDTGVSYNTQEIGADAELASQAFDVLLNHKYADAVPETYEGMDFQDLTEEEQYRTGYELEYIIDEYRNADDKTIALLAYNMWSQNVHPYIEEDIQKKWETETNEIDRYQTLNKFEQAKEDLKLYAATLKGYGAYSSQFAEYARAIVKRLDFMTESDKARLFDKLIEFNSFRDIEKNLDDVMDYAQTLADVSDRKYLAEQIDREVRQTIHVWQNGIKKTKYTYPANKLFERLREINKMSSAAVHDMYDAYLNEEFTPDYADDTVHDKDYYTVIEQQFVKYKINGMYNSTEFLQDLLERLQSAKYTAKLARDEMDFERRMQQLNLVDECARAVNSRKEEIDKNPYIKTTANLNSIGANLNNYLEMIFNEGIKKQFSLDYKFAQKDAKTGAEKRAFEDKAKKIFGFSGKFSNTQLYNKFINMTVPEYKILQRYSPDIEQGSYRVTQQMPETGFNATQYTQQIRQDIDFAKEWQPEEIELSRMEILYYYIQAKNPTSYIILTDKDKGQFDKFDFDAMIDTLTPQEKLLGDLMQLTAERYWNDLNAYHIKKYHTELGKVKNYFPRYTDFSEEKPYQIFNDFAQSTSSGSMQKQRIAGPGSRIKPANALAVLYDHMETANTITVMGEQLDLTNRVLLNKDLLKKIDAVFDSTVALQYQSAVTSMLYKSQSCIKSLYQRIFSLTLLITRLRLPCLGSRL